MGKFQAQYMLLVISTNITVEVTVLIFSGKPFPKAEQITWAHGNRMKSENHTRFVA